MPAITNSLKKLYQNIWINLAPGYRVLLVLLTAVCLSAVVGVFYWSTRPDYEILSARLEAKEASRLAEALEEAGIGARFGKDGSAVMVPRRERHRARMVAAREGLTVSAAPGFDTFRDPKIGMTPFAEKVSYLSALQNELAATIMTLEAVSEARVHLTLPERRLFREELAGPSASVLVHTRASRRIDRNLANSIANLVASAVEDLSPGNVTVTDSAGNVVTGADTDGKEVVAGDQFAYRQRVENYLAQKAESMLARAMGPGRSEIRVSADLDFHDERTRQKTYDEDNRVLVSEIISTSSSSGPGLRVGGMVGEMSAEDGSAQGAEPQQTRSEDIDTRFLVGESLTESVNRGVALNRLSVAALVDLDTDGEFDVEKVTAVIEDAVGLDRERGDTIRVAQTKFFHDETQPSPLFHSLWSQPAGRYAAVVLFGFILLFIARRVLKNLESVSGVPRKVLIPEVMTAEGTDETGMWDAGAEELMYQQVAKLVEEDPETAGRLIESWIEEGNGEG